MRIIRVFPRKTNATPVDELTCVGPPEKHVGYFPEEAEVHISTLFSYDIADALELKRQWEKYYPIVKTGGPAFGSAGGAFVPGRYVKKPYTITSRGCPNKCWFCDVWKREGAIRELRIEDGTNILDSNLLACSRMHILGVFLMLNRQKERPQFTGGLEAARLKPWHVRLLREAKTKQMFFAYDSPGDYGPLKEAGELLRLANFTRSHLRCYVLIGYPKDLFEKAEERLLQAWGAGFMPMAMLWRGNLGTVDNQWQKFQRLWARPAITKKIAITKSMNCYDCERTKKKA